MQLALLAAVVLSAEWAGECPSVHNEYYLMGNGECSQGLTHLIFDNRCLSAADFLGLTVLNETLLRFSDEKHPRGCFYLPGPGMVGFNELGSPHAPDKAICTRGTRIQTWGLSSNGGDSSTVEAELMEGVSQLYTNDWAFAALKVDGTVVAWGDDEYGGDATGVVKESITSISTTAQAFAALSHNGKVFTWGKKCSPSSKGANCGGNSSTVAHLLSGDVVSVKGTSAAFAALKADRTVVTWGAEGYGGDMATVASLLTDVQTIYSNDQAFAALTLKGSVVSWGGEAVAPEELPRVVTVANTKTAFAALLSGGEVATWGSTSGGGDDSTVSDDLVDVIGVTGNAYTFAAWRENGTVVTWGRKTQGADTTTVDAQLLGVHGITSNTDTFVALKKSFKTDWAAVAWGGGVISCCGGNATTVSSLLASDVKSIYSAESSYVALLVTGKAVTWGAIDVTPETYPQLDSDVDVVCSSRSAFAAIKTNGSVVAWGTGAAGNLSIKGMPLGEVAGTAVLLASAGQAYAVGIGEQPLPDIDTGISDGAGIALAVCFGLFALAILLGGPLYMKHRKRRDRAARRRRIRSYRRSYHAPRKPILEEGDPGIFEGYRSESEVSDD